MNAEEWIQMVSLLTATILSSVHPESHTPALISKSVGTAQQIITQVSNVVPPAIANPPQLPAVNNQQ